MRTEIEPIRQGNCDRFCGIYSILNALQLVSRDKPVRRQMLFDHAATFLIRRRKLNEVLLEGMATGLWRSMICSVVAKHNEGMLSPVTLIQLFPKGLHCESDGWALLSTFTTQKVPILAEFEKGLWHYTVIQGCDSKRLHLFDSEGRRWVSRSKCSLGRDGANKKYEIRAKSLVAVVA